MKKPRLNGWQRVWVVLSLALLLGIFIHAFWTWAWPMPDPYVLSALARPDCRSALEQQLPPQYTSADVEWTGPCAPLSGLPIRSLEDYQKLVWTRRWKMVGKLIGSWFTLVVGIYLGAWLIWRMTRWVAGGFRGSPAESGVEKAGREASAGVRAPVALALSWSALAVSAFVAAREFWYFMEHPKRPGPALVIAGLALSVLLLAVSRLTERRG